MRLASQTEYIKQEGMDIFPVREYNVLLNLVYQGCTGTSPQNIKISSYLYFITANMNRKVLCILHLMLLMSAEFLDTSTEAKKVIINVPYRVKNVKHTHTIYKIIPHYHKGKGHADIHEFEDSEYYR